MVLVFNKLSLNLNLHHRRSVRGLQTNLRIIDLNISSVHHIMKDLVTKAYFRLENKMKLLARTENEIFNFYPTISIEEKKKKDHSKPNKKNEENLF